jgi:hypothetical protein
VLLLKTAHALTNVAWVFLPLSSAASGGFPLDFCSPALPVFKWRQLCALARVTASEYGRPAPGMAEAYELLKS